MAAPPSDGEGRYVVVDKLTATGQGTLLARGPQVRFVVGGDLTLNMSGPGDHGIEIPNNLKAVLEFVGSGTPQGGCYGSSCRPCAIKCCGWGHV